MDTDQTAPATDSSVQPPRSGAEKRIRDAFTGAAVIAVAATFVSVISYSGDDPIGFSLIDPFTVIVLWLYLHSLRFTAPLLLTATASVVTMAGISTLQPNGASLDTATALLLSLGVGMACAPVALLLAFVGRRGVRDTSGPFPRWLATTWLVVPILFVGSVLALNWAGDHLVESCLSTYGDEDTWSCSG